MGRLIIIPVGDQVGAALCPLLEPALLPGGSDRVALIFSKRTAPNATRIEDWLKVNGAPVIERLKVEPRRFHIDLLDRLRSEAEAHDSVEILINGGPSQWAFDLLELGLAVPGSQGATVWVSRDERLLRYDLRTRAETWSRVPNFGRDALLRTLGVNLERGRLSAGAITLDSVLDLCEHSGFLYAVLDGRKMDLPTYRRFTLDYERLQRLGLEPRRIALLQPGFARAVLRCAQDGIVTLRDEFARKAWLTKPYRMAGGVADLPQAGRPIAGRVPSWSGDSLLVAMGTEPGSTLQAIWAHKPRTLTIAYDPESPSTGRLSNLLLSEPHLGCEVSLVPETHGRPFTPPAVGPESMATNLTPGDKIATLRLWAHGKKAGTRFWFLDRLVARPASGGVETPPATVPADTWFRFHAPGHISTLDCSASSLTRLANDVVPYLASVRYSELHSLALLQKRGARPLAVALDSQTLRLPNGSAFDISSLPPDARADFLNGGGHWLEWIAAAWLRGPCQLENVFCRVRVDWPGPEPEQYFRDDLDVVSQHQGQWALWSCKARSVYDENMKGSEDIEEALAQTNRILGRRRLAILLVPRLPDSKRPPWVLNPRTDVGRWQLSARQWAVDFRFLMNTEGVRKLASSIPR